MAEESEVNQVQPLVRLAVVCERVLHEKDETISLIRIVDRFTQTAGENSPEQMPAANVTLNYVLSTIGGEARGKRTLSLVIHKPDGSTVPGLEQIRHPVTYAGSTSTHNWIVRLRVTFSEVGTYWIDAQCEGETLTRLPLNIRYVRGPQSDGSVH